ncbi:LysR substrate-binding domain-containing protein [Neobacillus drentensis]|uniref:selenium metabolism-associated LysR family transcriptional regulator n=1 Tax=Neobacillus drentensis TaxID=220684 RepID=UPI001F3F08C6|nr:selenium metabolism-associated LysR family transcriptional regulator [Neobacillus drentensis]ULT57260.1 LysR substrate-binding domain-containing protein [Neobacillus drentensis]
MNLTKLKAFILVIEKKSFSEAAIALKSSQPATSLKIKSLEEEMGLDLLDRGSSVIQPTAAGMIVYQASKEMVRRWRKLEDDLRVFEDTLTGTLTIGASTIPGTYLVPSWVKKFRSLYPNVAVTIEISDSKETLSKLHNQLVDVSITGLPSESKELSYKQVSSDALVLIAPYHHPLGLSNEPTFEQIKQFDFVIREEGSGTRKVMEDYLSIHSHSLADLKSVVPIGSTEAVIAAVEAGLGISFVSKLAALPAAKAKRIQIIEKFEPFQRNFYFTTLSDAKDRPIIKEFSELIGS